MITADSFYYDRMSDTQLKRLCHQMQIRLMALEHPDRAEGVDPKQRPFYEATYEKANAELRRRESAPKGDK